MNHNDLHSGNIFIQELEIEEIFKYYINNNEYKIKSKYKVFLYDFDRSYVERFGENELLSDKICNNNSQCNIYIENKDILKILCYIVKTVKHNNILLNTISNSNTNIELLINIYNDGCFFDLNKNSDKDQIKFFKKFNSSETIVKKIGELLPSNSGKVKKENIFVLNKEFFKNDGSINIKKYEEIYNNTLDLDKSKEEPVKKDKYKKECNSDQIRNPATGRCVLKRSPTGKKIIAEMNNTGDKEPSKRKEPSKEPRKKDKKECNSDQIRNPATGRCVLKRSPLGKKIIASANKSEKLSEKIKIKKTLSNGNCFYSAIYRSLTDKNLLETLYDCINDLRSTNEIIFIEKFRNYLSNYKDIDVQYKQLFDNIEYNLRMDKDYKKTINIILKDMGDSRKIIKKFLKDDKFQNRNKNEFINKIKENIKKDKTYVGEFEVISASNILKNNCDIIVEKFTNLKNAINNIKNDSDSKRHKSIYLIIDQESEHWEYID